MPTTVYLTIRAARDDRRVAVREAHPDHPGGKLWVTGDGREHTAALTREVARRIGDGSVVVVGLAPLPIAPGAIVPAPPDAEIAALPARAKKGSA